MCLASSSHERIRGALVRAVGQAKRALVGAGAGEREVALRRLRPRAPGIPASLTWQYGRAMIWIIAIPALATLLPIRCPSCRRPESVEKRRACSITQRASAMRQLCQYRLLAILAPEATRALRRLHEVPAASLGRADERTVMRSAQAFLRNLRRAPVEQDVACRCAHVLQQHLHVIRGASSQLKTSGCTFTPGAVPGDDIIDCCECRGPGSVLPMTM